jgi:hypothetical protein
MRLDLKFSYIYFIHLVCIYVRMHNTDTVLIFCLQSRPRYYLYSEAQQ